MASYTLDLTDEQDALIQWLVGQYNLQHDSRLTAQQFISIQLSLVLAPYAESFKQTITKRVQDTFAKADSKTQAQILALLELDPNARATSI